jgi:alpha-glucosidase
VGIFLGVNWQNLKPADDSLFTRLDSVLDVYGKWGVKGIKVSYMNRDDVDMVHFYQTVLEKAAARKMMVVFHTAFKPTGLQRTWPNLITRDAVITSEANKYGSNVTPDHNVTIPFTRGVLGQMDYAPGVFSNASMDDFKVSYTEPVAMGTRAHQLAMFVVYQSPLQTIPGAPVSYEKEKGFDFIQLVPTVWDETRYIAGDVGQYIVIARRNGDAWYLGAMTNGLNREVEIPLEFLGGGQWTMKSWADGEATMAEGKKLDMEALDVSEKEVSSSETLTVTLGPGGGFAAAFNKK